MPAEGLAKIPDNINDVTPYIIGLGIFYVVRPFFQWLGRKFVVDKTAAALKELRADLVAERERSNEFRGRLMAQIGESMDIMHRMDQKAKGADINLPKESMINTFRILSDKYALMFLREVERIEARGVPTETAAVLVLSDALHATANNLHRRFAANGRLYAYEGVKLEDFTKDTLRLFKDTATICMDNLVLSARGESVHIQPNEFDRYFENWRSQLLGNYVTYLETSATWSKQNTDSARYESIMTNTPTGETEYL